MTNFQNLPISDKIEINVFFNNWLLYNGWRNKDFKTTKAEIVKTNFLKDHFLDNAAFVDITNYIISNCKENLEEILVGLRDYIRRQHHFKGAPIQVNPITIGTVIIKDKLKDHLVKSYANMFYDIDYLEKFLSTDPNIYTENQKNYILKPKNWHIWITWNELNSNLSPFAFSDPLDKNEICKALGLDGDYLMKELILMLFKPDTNKYMIRPTIADANFDNHYWRPTKEDFKKFGLTEPTNAVTISPEYDSKRPEAVICSENLSFKFLFLISKLDNHA